MEKRTVQSPEIAAMVLEVVDRYLPRGEIRISGPLPAGLHLGSGFFQIPLGDGRAFHVQGFSTTFGETFSMHGFVAEEV